MLAVGDYLITLVDDALDDERIESVERIEGAVRTVAIHVPGTNTYLAEGVWTHNDAKGSSSAGEAWTNQSSSHGPGISNSGGSGGDSGPTILTTGSSSSSSSNASKSSGSSFASSSSIGINNTGESTME